MIDIRQTAERKNKKQKNGTRMLLYPDANTRKENPGEQLFKSSLNVNMNF